MRGDETPDHGAGLADDLPRLAQQMVARRRALSLFGGAGLATLLAGCGGSDSGTVSSSSTSSTSTTTTSTGTTSTGTTTTGTTTTTTTTTSSCIADPAETAGPYPADGTNSSSGSTNDVLTATGVVRSDIRASFISSLTVATGVQVTITLTLVNAANSCSPLSGYAIYLWHCDQSGNYSLYGAPSESYLRGVQVTDSNGQVTFTTIFPACYDGRWPHMHFEIFKSLSVATTGKNATLTSQLAMPTAICTTVYNGASGYSSSVTNFAKVSLSSDGVFGDDTTAQIAQMTPTMTGSVSTGYVATAIIGVSV